MFFVCLRQRVSWSENRVSQSSCDGIIPYSPPTGSIFASGWKWESQLSAGLGRTSLRSSPVAGRGGGLLGVATWLQKRWDWHLFLLMTKTKQWFPYFLSLLSLWKEKLPFWTLHGIEINSAKAQGKQMCFPHWFLGSEFLLIQCFLMTNVVPSCLFVKENSFYFFRQSWRIRHM